MRLRRPDRILFLIAARQHCRQKVDSARRMEAVWTRSGIGGRAKHGSLVMAKAKGGGKLHPLPFTMFGEIAALGLRARVYCSRCYEHRPIDPAAEHLRDRCFATTRFRCTQIRYTGNVCGSPGSVEIEPSVLATGRRRITPSADNTNL